MKNRKINGRWEDVFYQRVGIESNSSRVTLILYLYECKSKKNLLKFILKSNLRLKTMFFGKQFQTPLGIFVPNLVAVNNSVLSSIQ